MAAFNSETSDLSDNVSVSESNESIEALSCALQLSRRKLDKELTNAIKDCSPRTNVWTTAYFNERVGDLEKKKDDFFDMVSLLVERCVSFESHQYDDILDNCELFRARVITLWIDLL